MVSLFFYSFLFIFFLCVIFFSTFNYPGFLLYWYHLNQTPPPLPETAHPTQIIPPPGNLPNGASWSRRAGFAAGAVISGAIVNGENRGNAHVQWCYDRYRSYRASDNTFQPNNGPRQQCRSPY